MDNLTNRELADRLNNPPIIYSGCTGKEIMLSLMLAFFLCLLIGCILYAFLGSGWILLVIPCFAISFYKLAALFSGLREQKPRGFLAIRVTVLISKFSKSSGSVVVSQRWGKGRSL